MTLKSLYPVIVTDKLAEARDFYVQHLSFRVVFETDWYVQLHASRGDDTPPIELAFMVPHLENQPASLQAAFSGAGVILTIEVEKGVGLILTNMLSQIQGVTGPYTAPVHAC